MVPGLETKQKILLRCGRNADSVLQCWLNLVEKVNAKKIDLIPHEKKKGDGTNGLTVRAGGRPIFMRKEEGKTFHHTV